MSAAKVVADAHVLIDFHVNGRHDTMRHAGLHIGDELIFGILRRPDGRILTAVDPAIFKDEIRVRLQSFVSSARPLPWRLRRRPCRDDWR